MILKKPNKKTLEDKKETNLKPMSESGKVVKELEVSVVTQDPFRLHLIKTRFFLFYSFFLLSWLHCWLALSKEKRVNWFI